MTPTRVGSIPPTSTSSTRDVRIESEAHLTATVRAGVDLDPDWRDDWTDDEGIATWTAARRRFRCSVLVGTIGAFLLASGLVCAAAEQEPPADTEPALEVGEQEEPAVTPAEPVSAEPARVSPTAAVVVPLLGIAIALWRMLTAKQRRTELLDQLRETATQAAKQAANPITPELFAEAIENLESRLTGWMIRVAVVSLLTVWLLLLMILRTTPAAN